jgi:hypothetical protein
VVPDDIEAHTVGGAVAIVGMYPAGEALGDVSATKIRVGKDGGTWVSVSDAVKVKAELDKIKTDLGTVKSTFDNHTHATALGPSGPPVPLPTILLVWTPAAVTCANVEVT